MNEPTDFISSTQPTPVADQILAHAMQAGKTWNDQTEVERMGSMIGAIVAYLELKNKKTMINDFLRVEPKMMKAIDTAEKTGAVMVMTVEGFQTNEEASLLRDALWYANFHGVVVHFVPQDLSTDD